jgi:hypothetical protein
MTITEGLLIVIVIILVVLVVRNRTQKQQFKNKGVEQMSLAPVEAAKHVVATHKATPENKTQAENAEYFTAAGVDTTTCDPNSNFEYAVEEFGGPGLEFKDWAMSQAVDPAVIKNHSEFVKDRQSKGTWTGRTWTAESKSEMETTDGNGWIGIRGRPQNVEVDPNAAQVAEINPNNFTNTKKLTWSSS